VLKPIVTVALCLMACIAVANDPPARDEPAAAEAAAPEPEARKEAIAKADAVKFEGKLPPGFKVKKRGKFTLYCKTDTPLGSRFKKETCLDDAQMRDYMVALQENKSDIDRIRATCSNVCVCGGDC